MRILRTGIWWNAVVPQVLGWIYFCWLCDGVQLFRDIYPSVYLFRVACFFISLISISAFGYLFNDLCDVEADAIAGKQNYLVPLKPIWRIVIVAFPFLVGCIFWMPVSKIATILFALQIIALIIYSAPPFRLKNRNFWGVVADAFYGHINPVFITLFAFNFFGSNSYWYRFLIGSVLFVVVTLKGIRNILLHQMDDRKKDRKVGIETAVIKNGGLFALYLVNNMLLFEIIFTVILSLAISFLFPPFILCLLFFSVITYLKFSGWKLADIPKRQLKFKFLYFLNDYYEGWVSVFFLIVLSGRNPVFLLLLLLHLVLFPSFITKLWKDLKVIKQNFKTEDEY